MLNKRTLNMLLYTLTLGAIMAIMATSSVSSETPSVIVHGQVLLNDEPVNGATVTCNGNTTTTSSSMFKGYYTFTLPVGKDYPITAKYDANGTSYAASDNIDLTGTSASSTPIALNGLNLQPVSVATATPTPTPIPNSTVTPTPNATATVSPTASPNATITATPTTTPAPTAAPASQPASNPAPVYTPVYAPTPVPTVTAVSTPLPTPTARKIFSSPNWIGDRETIIVNNTGDRPITVRSWIGDPSNNVTVPIDANATKTVGTPFIVTQNNQILDVGYDAYENGTMIDSYKATLSMGSTPTPVPTTARSPGFAGAMALICLLGAAYLIVKKER